MAIREHWFPKANNIAALSASRTGNNPSGMAKRQFLTFVQRLESTPLVRCARDILSSEPGLAVDR